MNIQAYEWGADVYCGSDVCAKLSRVVVDPERGAVTDLVVEQGLLMKKAWVVPRRHVQQTDERGIWLTLSEEELGEMAPYKRRVVEEVAEGYEQAATSMAPTSTGIPDIAAAPTVSYVIHDGVASSELRVLGSGVDVRDLIQDKTLGKLKQIVADAQSGAILQLGLSGGLFGEDSTLQSRAVTHYDEDRILVQEEKTEESGAGEFASPTARSRH